mmetsp:Transcript_52442/g.147175  ORF Transcript_52442/g.147175 Transcript_52442/m.147175 type:complete len:320 (+) Transcript_52442:448-1407(+)
MPRGQAQRQDGLLERWRGNRFQGDEQGVQTPPSQQLRLDVVPICDEEERRECGQDAPVLAAEGHVDVAHQPLVERYVPRLPEGRHRVVVVYTPSHILWRVDAVGQRPATRDSPDHEKLQPHDVQCAQHGWGPQGRLQSAEDTAARQGETRHCAARHLEHQHGHRQLCAVPCQRFACHRSGGLELVSEVIEGDRRTGDEQRSVEAVRHAPRERVPLPVIRPSNRGRCVPCSEQLLRRGMRVQGEAQQLQDQEVDGRLPLVLPPVGVEPGPILPEDVAELEQSPHWPLPLFRRDRRECQKPSAGRREARACQGSARSEEGQ